jgi:hypothetical protein
MIRFYFHPTPNPAKIALFLEETGLPCEVNPVDTSRGEQHTPAFRAINPNGKVPTIVDTDGPGGKEAPVFFFEMSLRGLPSLTRTPSAEIMTSKGSTMRKRSGRSSRPTTRQQPDLQAYPPKRMDS